MATIRKHIRGNFGTQLLQAATVLADINPTDEPIICVNHGGLKYDGTNHLNDVCKPNFRIIDVDTTNKTPYWVSGNAEKIFKTQNARVRRWLNFINPPSNLQSSNMDVLHMRFGDKEVCSESSLRVLLQYAYEKSKSDSKLLAIYSNDIHMAAAVNGSFNNVFGNNPIDDWYDIYAAPTVYASPSSFIVSMLIFNPEKHIIFTGDTLNDGPYNIYNDMMFLKEAATVCPNVEFLDVDI